MTPRNFYQTCNMLRAHRGNRKVERMIPRINERVSTNKKIIVEREKTRISNILLALGSEKDIDGNQYFRGIWVENLTHSNQL